MADTSVKIDTETRKQLGALAKSRGLSLRDLVAALAADAEQTQAQGTATAQFRRAIGEPGLVERFDEDFGGLPSQSASRAA